MKKVTRKVIVLFILSELLFLVAMNWLVYFGALLYTVIHEFGHFLLIRHSHKDIKFGICSISHIAFQVDVEKTPIGRVFKIKMAGPALSMLVPIAAHIVFFFTHSLLWAAYAMFCYLFAISNILPIITGSDGAGALAIGMICAKGYANINMTNQETLNILKDNPSSIYRKDYSMLMTYVVLASMHLFLFIWLWIHASGFYSHLFRSWLTNWIWG